MEEKQSSWSVMVQPSKGRAAHWGKGDRDCNPPTGILTLSTRQGEKRALEQDIPQQRMRRRCHFYTPCSWSKPVRHHLHGEALGLELFRSLKDTPG